MKAKKEDKRKFDFGLFLILIGLITFIFALLGEMNYEFNFNLITIQLSEIGFLLLLIGMFIYFAMKAKFRKQFKTAFKEMLPYAVASFIVFILAGFFGYFYPKLFTNEIFQWIQTILAETEGLGLIGLIKFLMFNNIRSSFFALTFGILTVIFPIFVILLNGYLVGFVSSFSVAQGGLVVLWRLVPHGIFEIPAFLISVGLGFKLGLELLKSSILFYHPKKDKTYILWLVLGIFLSPFAITGLVLLILLISNPKLRNDNLLNIQKAFMVFVFVVVPLLIFAGLIEGALIYFIKL